jgi:hypothetical protein
MNLSPILGMRRWPARSLLLVGLLSAVGVAACKQDANERCQQDSDCASGLVCVIRDNIEVSGVCLGTMVSSGTGGVPGTGGAAGAGGDNGAGGNGAGGGDSGVAGAAGGASGAGGAAAGGAGGVGGAAAGGAGGVGGAAI